LVGFGRIWSDLVGFGRIWSDLVFERRDQNSGDVATKEVLFIAARERKEHKEKRRIPSLGFGQLPAIIFVFLAFPSTNSGPELVERLLRPFSSHFLPIVAWVFELAIWPYVPKVT
jgi:hypothetical protein